MTRAWWLALVAGVLGMVMACGGCTPNFKACQIGALDRGKQAVVATVQEIAMNPSSWPSDLFELGLSLGKDQVFCAAVALKDWLEKTDAPAMLSSDVSAPALFGQPKIDRRAHAKEVLKRYLKLPNTHTASAVCRPSA